MLPMTKAWSRSETRSTKPDSKMWPRWSRKCTACKLWEPRGGKSKELPVDVKCPYFGHLKLTSGGKQSRDVLIGNRGFVKAGAKIAIVDWRNAPVSRIYYTYEEGDDYEESFGGKQVEGLVEAAENAEHCRRSSSADHLVVWLGSQTK